MQLRKNRGNPQLKKLRDRQPGKKSPYINCQPSEKKNHGSIFDLRTSNDKDKKTAILIKKSTIELTDESKRKAVEELTKEGFKSIPNHVRLQEVLFDENGSPYKGFTPGKTELHVSQNTGIYFFSENKMTPHRPYEPKDTPSDELKNVVTPPSTNIKQVVYCLTPRSTRRREAKRVKKGGRRPITQNTAMKAGGKSDKGASVVTHFNAAVKATPKKPNTHRRKFRKTDKVGNHDDPYIKRSRLKPAEQNWGHMQGHAQGGAQHSDNLVAISAHSNTIEMTLDKGSVDLLSKGYSKVDVEVNATLLPKTHIATDYKKKIKTVDFVLKQRYPQGFDKRPGNRTPYGRTKPSRKTGIYIEKLINALAGAHGKKSKPLAGNKRKSSKQDFATPDQKIGKKNKPLKYTIPSIPSPFFPLFFDKRKRNSNSKDDKKKQSPAVSISTPAGQKTPKKLIVGTPEDKKAIRIRPPTPPPQLIPSSIRSIRMAAPQAILSPEPEDKPIRIPSVTPPPKPIQYIAPITTIRNGSLFSSQKGKPDSNLADNNHLQQNPEVGAAAARISKKRNGSRVSGVS